MCSPTQVAHGGCVYALYSPPPIGVLDERGDSKQDVSYLAKGNKHLLLRRPYGVIRVEPKTPLKQQQVIHTVTTTTT